MVCTTGLYNFIASVAGFPVVSSFTPRFSIAGRMSGNGLPVALGLDYTSGTGTKTKWIFFCGGNGDCPTGYKCMNSGGSVTSGGVCMAIRWCERAR